jgi:hypothetical protein
MAVHLLQPHRELAAPLATEAITALVKELQPCVASSCVNLQDALPGNGYYQFNDEGILSNQALAGVH